MINVGQGDSFLLTLESSKEDTMYVLIDGGPPSRGDYLVKHLQDITPGYIDFVIGTHLDSDHIGGLVNVIKNIEVEYVVLNIPSNWDKWLEKRDYFRKLSEKTIYFGKFADNLSITEELLNVIENKRIALIPLFEGEDISHNEDFLLRVLSPTFERLEAAWADEVLERAVAEEILETAKASPTTPRNDASIILELIYKNKPYALFTSDASAGVIKEAIGNTSYEFLKIPHHGSKFGLDEELIKQIRPKTAYLSVGDNPYGHPATEVLEMLKNVGAKVYCSNRTKYCKRDCKYNGFGNLCHRKDKDPRPNWKPVDSKKCLYNL